MFVKIIYRHFVFNQEKYQVCKFRIYRHFVKSVNGSNFPVLFRIKLARAVPADRNRPDVIQKRLDYANWFMGHAVVNHTVFIDERGYNIWTSRSQGRARRGQRAYR